MDNTKKKVAIDGANKHPDFICRNCAHMAIIGAGAEYCGQSEYYIMACKAEPEKKNYPLIIDAECDGPFSSDDMTTEIIVDCPEYSGTLAHDR